MRRWILLSALLTLVCLGACLTVWFLFRDRLPVRVPIHWNLEMEADGWVDRTDLLATLLLWPGVMGLLTLLLPLLSWLSPKRFKVAPFAGVFGYALTLAVGLIGFLCSVWLWAIFTDGRLPANLFVGAFFLFFALLGIVLGKVRRNFWLGIRTPWTLASEPVWDGTHRMAAWVWTVMGILGCIGVVVGVPLLACFGLMLVGVLVPAAYSLVLYKRMEKEGRV